ncbi:MAG: glycosyltransferase family 25 protein [Chloroherpetonaceae bacterium]|nr:glycosyltransferase family 25 protein [Chloroherpetonaceae bacterium]
MTGNTFAALNRTFAKIYVITLERAKDRQAQFQKSLAGIDYEVVYGVDKQVLSFETLRYAGDYHRERAMKLNRYVIERELTLGQIACSLSHRSIYERMVNNGIENALIFEDDAIPIAANLHRLEATLNDLPNSWELVYLGYTTHEKPISKSREWLYNSLYSVWHGHKYRWRAKDVPYLFPREYSQNLYLAGYHDCTHAYALNLNAAKKLFDLQRPVVYCADSALTHLITRHRLNAFAARAKFFDQADFALGHDGSTSYVVGKEG